MSEGRRAVACRAEVAVGPRGGGGARQGTPACGIPRLDKQPTGSDVPPWQPGKCGSSQRSATREPILTGQAPIRGACTNHPRIGDEHGNPEEAGATRRHGREVARQETREGFSRKGRHDGGRRRSRRSGSRATQAEVTAHVAHQPPRSLRPIISHRGFPWPTRSSRRRRR